jgi:indolepyruvate ferredoxin oxidoreductase
MPLSLEAILRAIELNGAAVEDNLRAFHWGRRAAHDPAGVEALLGGGEPGARTPLSRQQPRRTDRAAATTWRLSGCEAYARRYLALVERVRAPNAKSRRGGDTALTDSRRAQLPQAARLQGRIRGRAPVRRARLPEALAASFEGDYRLNFHITLPWSRGAGPGAEPKKIRFGPWLLPAMKLLARFKFLRGTASTPSAASPNACRSAN